MTKAQLARRSALLDRQDAALQRWRDRKSPVFIEAVTRIAHELEALALEADQRGGDRLDRARTWRFAGSAYAAPSIAQHEIERLTPAAQAFAAADALLAGVEDPIERLKLDYAYGSVQFRLARGSDVLLAANACYRLTSALELARRFSPPHVPDIEKALADAEQGFALVQEGANLGRQIASLGAELSQLHQREVRAGLTQQPGQADAVAKIVDLARTYTPELGSMIEGRGKLREAAQQLRQAGEAIEPSLPDGSRAAEAWQCFAPLKTALWDEYWDFRKAQYSADDTKKAAIDLYTRIGEATTRLEQHADDDQWVRSHERHALRPLAVEMQQHLRRNHLTVARPIWPSSSQTQRAGRVFYAGGQAVMSLVTAACERTGLTMHRAPVASNYASARWDALRSSHIAVFDFTAYKKIDVESHGLSSAKAVAAVAYELGIALAIGCPVLIVAPTNTLLPFDLDIDPVCLPEPLEDAGELRDAIENAVYGVQRREGGSSLSATRAYLRQAFDGANNAAVREALRLMDDSVDQDAVKLRRLAEAVLGAAGDSQMEVIFPAWPGGYPDRRRPTLFHVMPFRPTWADHASTLVAEVCAQSATRVTYVRDDQELTPDVIMSIWNHLCDATHVVVDLTGFNPNVCLELGIAHTLGRNVLLVSQDEPESAIFRHLEKLRLHTYTLSDSDARSLRRTVQQFLSARASFQ